MRKKILIMVAAFSIFLSTPLYADECMEGDCDNGYGTGFTEDNKVYEGEWQDGMPHGQGKLFLSKGKVIEGVWEKGELVEDKPEKKVNETKDE